MKEKDLKWMKNETSTYQSTYIHTYLKYIITFFKKIISTHPKSGVLERNIIVNLDFNLIIINLIHIIVFITYTVKKIFIIYLLSINLLK